MKTSADADGQITELQAAPCEHTSHIARRATRAITEVPYKVQVQ